LIGEGLSAGEATAALVENYRTAIGDPDEGPVFWLALALTQWKIGRLQDEIRDHALSVIESGADLHRWREQGLVGGRERVLTRVRDQLLAPPRPLARIPKRIPEETPFRPGDAVAYLHDSAAWLALWCIDLHTDRGGTYPVFELLDFVAESPPMLRAFKRLPAKTEMRPTVWSPSPAESRVGIVALGERDRPRDRIRTLGNVRRKRDARPMGRYAMDWKRLDPWLASILDLP